MAYTIPPGNEVAFGFDGTVYTPPAGNAVALRFGGLPNTAFAVGFNAAQFGTAKVANVTQQVFPQGWNSGAVSGHLVVTKSLQPPGFLAGVFGIPALARSIPVQGFAAELWGRATVRNLLGGIEAIGWDSFVGSSDAVVTGKQPVQRVAPPGANTTLFGALQVFPLTLGPHGYVASAWGTAKVANLKQFVRPSGLAATVFGTTKVFNFLTYVAPQGITPPLMGFPVVFPVKIHPFWLDYGDLFGTATVKWRWPSAVGFVATRFGSAKAYNKTTIVRPAGPVFSQFGVTWVSTKPQYVGGSGVVESKFGTADVELFDRPVFMQGEDLSYLWGYSPATPWLRTHVYTRIQLGTFGLGDQAAFGQPFVSTATRTLYPRPVFFVGRPQAPTVKARSTIAMPGFDSEAFGDIQRWEAGKIKPHGDDMAALGRAVLNRVMHGQGALLDVFGATGVAAGIVPAAVEMDGFGAPTFTAMVCGTRAMAYHGFDSSNVGSPEVAHA